MNDPIESIIAAALDAAGIVYDHDHSPGRLERHPGIFIDFYLPQQDIWIECKQFHSERTSEQLKQAENVILIQGRRAARAFAEMVKKSKQTPEEE